MPVLPFESSAVKEIPTRPGVYVFLDDKKKPLYVGKASNLRSRVRSYFSKSTDHRLVTAFIDRYATTMDYIVTDSEKDALLLENSMIKKHAPRFNIRLRDDKTYFSLRLDLKATWPWFTIVRRRKKEDNVLYFGPYTSALSCRRTLQFLNTLFPLRTCTDSVLENRTRPCLSYEIKRCVAPCVGYVERAEYMKIVEQAVMFMKGKNTELLTDLRQKMWVAAEGHDFESAALLRDRIQAIETTLDNPQVTKNVGAVFDAIGLYQAEDEVHLVVLHVRDGVLSASASFKFPAHHDTDALLASFLGQFYSGDRPVPQEIIMPEECVDMPLLGEVLGDVRGTAVKLVVPERGEKKKMLGLAERNAELAWLQHHEASAEVETTLAELQDRLDLVRLPRRIECFDISNLMGQQVVGSCVAFMDGRPDKQRYRRYRIKSVDGQDDFASMAEVVRRRVKRGLAEDDLPDLLVIDGGRGQLGAACEVVKELGVALDVVSLAKARSGQRVTNPLHEKERIFKPESEVPIVLEQSSAPMRLLVQLRDEAHRFAITYHRRLRTKSQIGTSLELIPGIGKQKARALLERFGSIKGVLAAADDDLSQVKGVTPGLVGRLREFFANQGNVAEDDHVVES